MTSSCAHRKAHSTQTQQRAHMSLCELLAEASLGHCAEAMSSETLESCASRIAQGRPAFLKHIKEIGIEKLSDRQKIATLIAKAAKSGGVAPAPAKQKRALENLDLARELIQYIHDLSDGECSRKLEPLKPLGATPPMRGEPAAEGSASVALASRPEARVRLVAIYGSGCTAESFDAWRASAPTWLELRVLELQGIGTRESEGLWSLGYRCEEDKAKSDDELTAKVVRERDVLISSLADQLTPLLDADAPYALYGFSSGALFIYLLALELARRRAPLPFRLFAAGRGAPHCCWTPSIMRHYMCEEEEQMELGLRYGLGVPLLSEAEDAPEEIDPALIVRKNAMWRAPLLTASIGVGTIDPSQVGGTMYDTETRKKGPEVVRHIIHASDAPRVPMPIVMLASTNDRIWPMYLATRWEDVAPAANSFKLVEVGTMSHFSMMTSEAVQEAVHLEMAAAAWAQVSSHL